MVRRILFILILTASEIPAAPLRSWMIDYARGFSTDTVSDLKVRYGNNNYTYHDVVFNDGSFSPDKTPFLDEFWRELGKGKIDSAFLSLVAGYYDWRVSWWNPDSFWGVGVEHNHFKIYTQDYGAAYRISGTRNGAPVSGYQSIGTNLKNFEVSDGINQVYFNFMMRLPLWKSDEVPDGQLQPYVMFGAGPAIPHTEVTTVEGGVPVKRADSYQFGFPNIGIQWANGIRYKAGNRWGFFLEQKIVYTWLHDMHFDKDRDARLKADFSTIHLQWGVSIFL